MIKEKGLTTREKNFLKEYMLTGNATDAAMKVCACNTRASAATMGSRMLRKVEINDEVEFWLNKLGITDKEIAKTIKEGLKANKVVSAVKTSKEAGASDTDFIDVPDWNARNKTLELLLKIRGKLINRNLNENLDYAEAIAEIRKTLEGWE